MKTLQVDEKNHIFRIGLKGPQAASWLAQQKISLPAPWYWLQDQEISIYRLGQSEFVLETEFESARMVTICAQLQSPIAQVYPVVRYDASWQLAGDTLHNLLAEVCMLDWQLETQQQRVCITQLAGIHATLTQEETGNRQSMRIWCDAGYRDYLQEIFTQAVG